MMMGRPLLCRSLFLFSLLFFLKRIVKIKAFVIGTSPRGLSKLTMRDGSTATTYFSVGDSIRVITDVWHHPPSRPSFNSFGLIGVVVDIWEKCEVDPHCCCAELAFDAPIEVKFEGIESYPTTTNSWTAHYSCDEIERVSCKSSD